MIAAYRDPINPQEVCAAAEHILLVDGRQAEAEHGVVRACAVRGTGLHLDITQQAGSLTRPGVAGVACATISQQSLSVTLCSCTCAVTWGSTGELAIGG
jgi:hypothetical protein